MNAKIVKTRKALLDALIAMLETEPLESISVSRLCQHANINRTTFYKYYSIPADIILEAVDEIMEQTLQINASTLDECLLAVCQAFYEHRKMMALYTKSTGSLFQLFYTVLMRHAGKLAFLSSVKGHFLAGGVASVLVAWMVRGFPESPEELAANLAEYISAVQSEDSK